MTTWPKYKVSERGPSVRIGDKPSQPGIELMQCTPKSPDERKSIHGDYLALDLCSKINI